MYYFGQRYYDSQTSRWMSADPIYDGLKSGMSIFGYCRNNPLIYKDPNGLEVFCPNGNSSLVKNKFEGNGTQDTAITGKKITGKDGPNADRYKNDTRRTDNVNRNSIGKSGSGDPNKSENPQPGTYPEGYENNVTGSFGQDYTNAPSHIRHHEGYDRGAPIGTRADASGYSQTAYLNNNPDSNYGRFIILQDLTYPDYFYAIIHLDMIVTYTGAIVRHGNFIALTGNSGAYSSGPHAHDQTFFNPSRSMISQRGGNGLVYIDANGIPQLNTTTANTVNPFNWSESWGGY